MSKNKDIEFLHQVTGKSYKECRQLYTLCHGDIYAASGLDIPGVFDHLFKITDAMVDAFKSTADAIKKVADSIDWDALNKAIQIPELPKINEQEFMLKEITEVPDND